MRPLEVLKHAEPSSEASDTLYLPWGLTFFAFVAAAVCIAYVHFAFLLPLQEQNLALRQTVKSLHNEKASNLQKERKTRGLTRKLEQTNEKLRNDLRAISGSAPLIKSSRERTHSSKITKRKRRRR